MAEEQGAQFGEKYSSIANVRSDSNEEGKEKKNDGLVLAEVKKQCGLAWPIIFANLLSYSFLIVSVMFVGHLCELELSSASIAQSFAAVTGFSVMVNPYKPKLTRSNMKVYITLN
jgi:hypothetical protein